MRLIKNLMGQNSNIPKLIIAMSIASLVIACSAKKTKEDGEELPPPAAVADAGTDAVPLAATDAAPTDHPAGDPPPPPVSVPVGASPAATETAAAPEATPPAVSAPAAAEPSTSSSTGTGETESYTVKGGDTLMKIAFESLGDVYRWKEIYDANKDKLKSPNVVPKGMVLNIPHACSAGNGDKNGEKYLIKDGDTLGIISNSLYGTKKKWKDLWDNNKQLIRDPNKIFAGFYLYYAPSENGGSVSNNAASPAAAVSAAPSASAEAPAPSAGSAGADSAAEALHSQASAFSSSAPAAPAK